MKRNRQYNGQEHTVHGKRGSTEVKGLTFRDIYDCYIRAVIISAPKESGINPELLNEAKKGENANLSGNDLFGFNLDELDPIAISQNMSCEIEKMMGIYPNVDKVVNESGDKL